MATHLNTAVASAIAVLSLLLPPSANGQQASPPEAPDAATPAYKPPMRGAPSSRIGGGSRGAGDATPVVAVLAPDHTGLTIQDQPTVYWYVSGSKPVKLEITLIDEVSVKPLFEKNVDAPLSAGVQRLSFKELGVRLEPGVEYRWHVAVVLDPAQRSNDIIASASIKRVVQSDAIKSRVAGAGPESLAKVYAAEGIWYDAIDAIMERARANPADPAPKRHLKAMLGEAGLGKLVE